MFWGLIMEPSRRYTQRTGKSFRVTMAALDFSTSDDEPAQVMCHYEGRTYLLCTLRKPDLLQCHLDLEFTMGSEVCFAGNGNAHIHLTGHLIDEEAPTLAYLEEEERATLGRGWVSNKLGSSQAEKKKKGKRHESEPPSKKAKLTNGSAEEEDDESDDPDFEEEEPENEEDDDDEAEGEEDEDDESNDENEDEQDESDAGEEEEENEKQNENVRKKSNLRAEDQELNKKGQPKTKQKKTLEKGVIIEELVEGTGPVAKSGRLISVYYEGRLEKNNKQFDSMLKGPGFKFRLGGNEVIKGWDIGVAGMKVGGKRKVICPPQVAYGPKGSPPAIPPNSTLVFTIELKKVQ